MIRDHTEGHTVVTHVVVSEVPKAEINNKTNVDWCSLGSDGASSNFGSSFSGLMQSLSCEVHS